MGKLRRSAGRSREYVRKMDTGKQNGLRPRASRGGGGAKKLLRWLALCVVGMAGVAACAAPSPWRQPATTLAQRIADLLGPGPAHLIIRNISSIPDDQVAAIRELLVQALGARGVSATAADSANSIRVTLSESKTERLWVAQVTKGKQTQVAMVRAGPASVPQVHAAVELTLHRTPLFALSRPILATLETAGGLVVLEPNEIAVYVHAPDGWRKGQYATIMHARPLPRDPRGILLPSPSGVGFVAWLPGARCAGNFLAGSSARYWTIGCSPSEDPWVLSPGAGSEAAGESGAVATAQSARPAGGQANGSDAAQPAAPPLKAFYDARRNYFTGAVEPRPKIQLPPFYAAALLPRPAGDGLLIGGIDGKVQLLEQGALAPIGGTSEWGSDFAALHSGCGAGTQIVASAAGEAGSDSLRAYEVPGQDAIPVSEPLSVNGTVMALWTAPGGGSLMAVVRSAPFQYEVDRVTASCN